MSDTSYEADQAREPVAMPRLTIVLGAASIAAGIVVLSRPSDSLATLAVISGVFILVDGIVELAAAANGSAESRSFAGLLGVLDLVVGLLLIRHPVSGVFAIALLIGIWLMAAGMLRLIVAFAAPEQRGRRIASAAVLAIVGIVIVSSPHLRFTTLALLTGIGFIAYGLTLFVIVWASRLAHDAHTTARRAGAHG
jgi:uncharacterized membrane protein HdeD (DUF308 family)